MQSQVHNILKIIKIREIEILESDVMMLISWPSYLSQEWTSLVIFARSLIFENDGFWFGNVGPATSVTASMCHPNNGDGLGNQQLIEVIEKTTFGFV